MATTKSSGGVRKKTRELRWPALGVVRRTSVESRPEFREPFPSPWASNCRLEDQLSNRLRGGSRPGLTLWNDDLDGSTIDGMLSVSASSDSGVARLLALIADNALGVIEDGVYSTPVGNLATEGGDTIITEGGDEIVVSTGDVPSTCFLTARGRKVYAIASEEIVSLDPATGAVDTLEAFVGTVPSDCTHGCFYRDRLVLGGGDNAVYMSRQGDPTDWDYGVDAGDSGRALIFQLGEASEHGEAATALLPFQDSSLLAATQYSLWLVQGDPGATGTLRNLSRGVGIIGPRAWCAIQDARVGDAPVRHAFVFLSTLGLFMISPSGDGLQSLSEDRLPQELQDIAETTTVTLAYSPGERGVYIFLTPSEGDETHFFFDLVHQGFWPMALQTTHQPLSACWHEGEMLLASQDGKLRSVGGDDDDGEDIDSYVLIGPLRVSGPDTMGLLTRIHGMIGAGSGTVSWRIIPGDTAEEACSNGEAAITAYQAGDTAAAEAYAKASGTWGEGRSQTRYPRVRAMWMCVLLMASEPWAYESMTVESRDAGRWK